MPGARSTSKDSLEADSGGGGRSSTTHQNTAAVRPSTAPTNLQEETACRAESGGVSAGLVVLLTLDCVVSLAALAWCSILLTKCRWGVVIKKMKYVDMSC